MVNQISRNKRKKRIRARISGSSDRPRLVIYRSLKNLEIQTIDDNAGKTLLGAKFAKKELEGKTKEFAKTLKDNKIQKIVFDRGGFAYHGLIKQVAEILRKEGLEF